MIPDRAVAAFWASYLRNRNVDAGTAEDGAVPVAGGYALYVRASHHQVARAVGSARPLRPDDLAVLESFYGRRRSPVRLEIREEVLERDRALLEAAGYEAADTAIGFYATAAIPDDPGSEITVRQTTDRGGWTRLVTRAFAGTNGAAPDEAGRRSSELCAAAAHGLFIAEVGGVPAGGGAVAVLPGEVAFLFSGAVLPEFRGRRVHRALLRARAAFGVSRGANRTTVEAFDATAAERSIRRAGFERIASLRRVTSADKDGGAA
jgi:GNAT superfamily N-acetyltransferase